MAKKQTHQQTVQTYARVHHVSLAEAARARQGTHGNYTRETLAGRDIVVTKSAQRMRTEIGKTAQKHPGATVEVVVKTKDGHSRRLFVNPSKGRAHGTSASWLRGKLGKTAGQTKGALARQSAWTKGSDKYDPNSEIEVDEMAEYQVTVWY